NSGTAVCICSSAGVSPAAGARCCDDMREMNRQHDPGRPRHPQMNTAAAFAPRLRQDLLDAGYTIAQLRELFGPRAEAALEREQFLPALTSARERSGPGATLARLFLLGDAVTTAELMAALPRTGAEVIEAGLVAPASQDAPRSQDLLHAA